MQKTHEKVEDCLALDSRSMAKSAVFKDGRQGTWGWHNTSTGEEVAKIGYSYHNQQLTLRYQSNKQLYHYSINIETTPCHYGGMRYWFTCPDCYKRAAKLYLRNSAFSCRICQKLNYATQQENKLDGTRLVMYRIRNKLNWQYDNAWMKPYYKIRPKGMHHSTYNRLVRRHDELERKSEQYCIANFHAFMNRHGLKPSWD